MTDGGDTERPTWFGPSKDNAAARTTAQKAVRRGLERLDEVARRFERDGEVAAAMDEAGRLGRDGGGMTAIG